MFCPECGKKVEEEAAFCPECGARVEKVKSGFSPSPSIGTLDKQTLLLLIGGALLLVSFFMSWVDLGFVSVSGAKLIKVATGAEKLLALIAWLIPIGGGITLYLGYKKHKSATKAALISGAIAALVWVWLFFSMGSEIKKMTGSFGSVFKAMGFGLWLMLAGIVCLAIAVESIFVGKSSS